MFSQGFKTLTLQAGEELLAPGQTPEGIWLIESGSLRSLACLPPSQQWRTVERHEAGDLVGWLSWLHQRPIEHLRAAEPSRLKFIPIRELAQLWAAEPSLRQWCAEQTPAIEAVHLLQQLAHADQGRNDQLEQWSQLLPKLRWLVDSDPTLADLDGPGHWHRPDGSLWDDTTTATHENPQQRLIWLPDPQLQRSQAMVRAEIGELLSAANDPTLQPGLVTPEVFELPRASGTRDIPLAICQAIALHYGVPFNRDSLLDLIDALLERQPQLNLFNIGQLISSLDLSVSLTEIPLAQLQRIPTPAVLEHQGHFAVLEGVQEDGCLRLLEPELGPLVVPAAALLPAGAERLSLILSRRRPGSNSAGSNSAGTVRWASKPVSGTPKR